MLCREETVRDGVKSKNLKISEETTVGDDVSWMKMVTEEKIRIG